MKIIQEIKEAFFPPLEKIKKSERIKQSNLFWNAHPEVQKKVIPIRGSQKWATIQCVWQERTAQGLRKPKTQQLPICIDRKSKYFGNIYWDDGYILLALKFALLIPGRGFHALFQTAYHVSMAGSIIAIIRGRAKKKTTSEIRQRIFRSLADIFRTPYYDALLGGTAVIALIGSVFKKTFFYDCRAFTGDQLNTFYRGKRFVLDGSPCMRRKVNVMTFEKNLKRQVLQDDTQYEDPNNATLVGLNNLARRWS